MDVFPLSKKLTCQCLMLSKVGYIAQNTYIGI